MRAPTRALRCAAQQQQNPAAAAAAGAKQQQQQQRRLPSFLPRFLQRNVEAYERLPLSYRRLMWRTIKFTTLGVTSLLAITLIPPREALPRGLLTFRILLEGLGRVLRTCYVCAAIVYDYKTTVDDTSSQEAWDACHKRAAQRLVMLAERNGGLYVKAGQGFCAMNHLLPPAIWKNMSILQNMVATRPYSEVVSVVEREYGRPLDDFFSEFSPRPIAAASMAQVHRARLKASGEEVAVKVQYIDIQTRFRGDMATINFMLKLCGYAFKGYDFSSVVTRAEGILEAELDFKQESKNAERCKQEMERHFGADVTCPTVRWEYTTGRVMVTDFIHGVKVSDEEGMARLGISKRWTMHMYIAAFAHQLFSTGFVHADPHPGNVFVHRHPRTNKPQLVILDHGLYVTLDDAKRHKLAQLWSAIVERDDDRLAAIALSMKVTNWVLLAGVFLQFPYKTFAPFQKAATAGDVELMRYQARQEMQNVTEILDSMPPEYALVLRNLVAVRATNKEVGNPVCRTALLYRYAIKESQLPALTVWLAVLRLHWQEWRHETQMALLKWWDPAIYEVVDEMLKIG